MDRYDPEDNPDRDFDHPDARSDLGDWQPDVRRRPLWASGQMAALLGALLVVLVGAAVVLSGVPIVPFEPGGPTPTPGTSAVAASPSASVRPTFVRPTPTPLPTFFVYLVRSGDSLNSIADDYGTTPRSIAFWNRERYASLDPFSSDYEPDRIEVGWQLQLLPNAVFDEEALPSEAPASPPASAPPSQTPTAAPSPASPTPLPTGPATVYSHGPRGTDEIALTLDMGGRLDPAVDIMNWLVTHGVKATIFPTGETGSTTAAGKAVLGIVRDHPELFGLGNHSWDHPSFTELTPEAMADQLWRTEAAVAPIAGRSTRPWFRPPYGAWNASVREAVGAAGWQSIVMWDVDTIDWRPTSDGGPTASGIQTKVLANAQGGSIVLMHLGGYHTLEALPGIVAGLADRGLRPVTLDEMLGG